MKQPFTLLFMGSITNPNDFYNKGGHYAIKLLQILEKDYNVNLTICSKVPKELGEEIAKSYNITLKANLNDKEIEEIYKESDVVISINPAMPFMATLEAKSYGVPMIALNTFGIRSYIKEGDGFLINPQGIYKQIMEEESYPCNVRDNVFKEYIRKINPSILKEAKDYILNIMKGGYKK